MDKLQWFKFSPSDWMMGRIQRCDLETQALFLRLCCIYWNKQCQLSKDDAIFEIDQKHFDILVSKRIIFCNDTNIHISFLDEQFMEINKEKQDKSKSGIIGNLKRWHRPIFESYERKEISLEDAIILSKNNSDAIAEQSHTDSDAIAEQSQIIAEKNRIDKDKDKEQIRKDKDNIHKNFTSRDFKKALLDLGAEEIHVDDWLQVRKDKKGSNTYTALKAFIDECNKHNYPISEAVKICAERSWVGFKYKWLNQNNVNNGNGKQQFNSNPEFGFITQTLRDKGLR